MAHSDECAISYGPTYDEKWIFLQPQRSRSGATGARSAEGTEKRSFSGVPWSGGLALGIRPLELRSISFHPRQLNQRRQLRLLELKAERYRVPKLAAFANDVIAGGALDG